MFADDEADLAWVIAENQRLRKLLHDLDEQVAAVKVDAKDSSVSAERPLPDGSEDSEGGTR
jgi:hypothetical protein